VHRIPRGVADDRLAVVATRAGVLVALDPRTGREHWRSGPGLWPVAVPAEAVVAVRAGSPAGPEVVVLDRADGRELWAAAVPGVPPWAGAAVAADPASALDGTLDGDRVLLRWRAEAGYRGGAAPPARVLAEHSGAAQGAVLVDLPSRSLEPAPAEEPAADRGLSVEGPAAGTPAADVLPADVLSADALSADVVAAGHAGGLRVELATPGTTDAVVLRGVDEADGTVRWQVALDEQVRRPPLRQQPPAGSRPPHPPEDRGDP
jgi:hypothetical protein